MSDQVQIFWDPYLQAFIIEVSNRNRSPSAAPPIEVTSNDFQAPPTRTASFSMNLNAPLGSFYNPIPHSSDLATMAANPTPSATPIPTTQASLHPPSWPTPSTAPLGSFHNPIPDGVLMPPGIAAFNLPSGPPRFPVSTPDIPPRPYAPSLEQSWQPKAAKIDALSGPPPPKPSPPNGAAQIPLPTAAPAPAPERGSDSPSELNTVLNASQPRTHQAANPARQSPRRTRSGRRVHFQDKEARTQATREAEARAAARARRNEEEVLDFTDANAANRLNSTHRRPPTASPRATFPERPPTPTRSTSQSLQPESRNSSTGSFVDPRGEWEFGRWPICTVCENRPVMINKSGIGFCDACFGQACAAEEARKRRDRGR